MAKRPAFRILITGSRTWDDGEVMFKLLHRIYEQVKDRDPILVHGAAYGADEMASSIWLELGGTIEPHVADWYPKRLHGVKDRQAGYIRNQKMVDMGANLCIAFIRDDSPGATHTAKRADAAGIKTWIIRRNTNETQE